MPYDHYSNPLINAPPGSSSVPAFLAGNGPDAGNVWLPERRLRAVDTYRHLFWEEDEAAEFYQVREGVLCLYVIARDGHRQIIQFCTAGDLVGIAPSGLHDYSAQTLSPAIITSHRLSELDDDGEQGDSLAESLLRQLCNDRSQVHRQMLVLNRKTATEKIVTLLLWFFDRCSVRKDGEGAVLAFALRSCDVADHLGLTRETVSRVISRLKKAEILDERGDGRLIALDLPRLRDIAAGTGDALAC